MENKIINYIDMKEDTSLKEVNLNRLDDFLTWEDNWNGYGAPVFNETLINHARELISLIDEDMQPEVFPNQGSGIQFEWESNRFYLEMELLSDDNFNIYYEVSDGKELHEGNEFQLYINKEKLNDFVKLVMVGKE